MSAAKELLKIVPTLQGVNILEKNLKLSQKKKIKTKDIFHQGVENIIGIELMKIESDAIEGFD